MLYVDQNIPDREPATRPRCTERASLAWFEYRTKSTFKDNYRVEDVIAMTPNPGKAAIKIDSKSNLQSTGGFL